MKIFEDLANLIIRRIEKETGEKIESFIGGSRRFGWNRKDSDIDIFLLIPNSILHLVESILISEGFIRNNDPIGKYESGFTQFIDPYHISHVNLTDNTYYFMELKKEHEKVEIFLKEKPVLKVIISRIKHKYNVSGKDIYRLLRIMI